MPTPIIYKKNLLNGIITSDMLSDCIYSVNKRAKNFRDKEADIRAERRFNPYFCDKYSNEEQYRNKKEEYYTMKERLLTPIDPICIHGVNGKYYLYYEIGGRGFHSPVWGDYDDPKIIKKIYPNLDIVEIGTLTTFGRDINDLVSVQFVRKVLKALEDGTAKLKID